jgi:hypothetical protein
MALSVSKIVESRDWIIVSNNELKIMWKKAVENIPGICEEGLKKALKPQSHLCAFRYPPEYESGGLPPVLVHSAVTLFTWMESNHLFSGTYCLLLQGRG